MKKPIEKMKVSISFGDYNNNTSLPTIYDAVDKKENIKSTKENHTESEYKSILIRQENDQEKYKVSNEDVYKFSRVVLVTCKEIIKTFGFSEFSRGVIIESCMLEIRRLIAESIESDIKNSEEDTCESIKKIFEEKYIKNVLDDIENVLDSIFNIKYSKELQQKFSIMGSLLARNIHSALTILGFKPSDSIYLVYDFITEYVDIFFREDEIDTDDNTKTMEGQS